MGCVGQSITSHDAKYLHHLVAEVVDDLHGDPAALGRGNGRETSLFRVAQTSRSISALSVVPGAVGVVSAEEVGVADEQALVGVVGVDEPARDAVGVVAPDLAGVGSKTSTPLTWTRQRAVALVEISISGSPKMTNRLPLPWP